MRNQLVAAMNRIVAVSVGCLLSLSALSLSAAEVDVSAAAQREAAGDLIGRVTSKIRDAFDLEIIPAVEGKDVYELSSREGRIVLRGNNGISLASAYHHYLRDYLKVQYSLWGDQMTLPEELPPVPEDVRVVSRRQFRHFFNYCTFNYTATWWDWDQWQRMIDFLAMHGVNMPLSVVGVEGVWYHSLLEVGFTDEEARAFIAAPVYLSWQWMSNLEGTGGPIPKSWIDSHLDLGRRIMDRQLSLGMTPIVNGFSGHVPRSFKDKFPDARIDIKGKWAGGSFQGAAQLDPTDPLFDRFGAIYLNNQIELLGTGHYYITDPFHEGAPPVEGDAYLKQVAERISALFTSVDPKAIWCMQSWSIRLPIVRSVEREKLLVMNYAKTKKLPEGYWYTGGVATNFGGRTIMQGPLKQLAANRFVADEDKHCVGFGFWAEGLSDNPVTCHLALDMNWAAGPIDLSGWLKGYARRRYGFSSDEVDQAWQLLVNEGPYMRGGYGYSSMLAARPGLYPPKSGPNNSLAKTYFYDTKKLAEATGLLLGAADLGKASAGFRYDAADWTRQCLSNLVAYKQGAITRAFLAGDREALAEAGADFDELLTDIDEITSSVPQMHMGRWLADAEAWAENDRQRAYYRQYAATLVTIWGRDPGRRPSLYDYAWREWGGLIGTFYKRRWEIFTAELDGRLARGQTYEEAPHAFFVKRYAFRADDIHSKLADFEEAWAAEPPDLPAEPQGDSVDIAVRLFAKYRDDLLAMPAKADILQTPPRDTGR